MWRGAFTGLLLALFPLAIPGAAAADAAVLGSVALRDGRVLHNASIDSDEGASVVLKSDEGLTKVSKDDLPKDAFPSLASQPAAAADGGNVSTAMVMKPFDPDAAPAEPVAPPEAKKPAPKQAAPVVPRGKPAASLVYKGCTITSFQVKPFQGVQGCLEVVVSNATDQIVVLRPGDFVCITASGARHAGRNFVTDGFPPQLKRREVVPQDGQIDDIVTFTDEALDNPTVQWAR
jgi:hypothetical protein